MIGTLSAVSLCLMSIHTRQSEAMDRQPTLSTRPNRRSLRPRTRGFRAQISTLIFQPITFFRDLATAEPNRQWFVAGFLVLALTGFAAVQRKSMQPVVDPFAVAPPAAADNWTTALVAGSVIVISWLVQALLLCEVSLLNGKMPRFGLNLRIAIWSSLPLGLMALLQLIYYAAGGLAGEPGISGVLITQPFYMEQPAFGQALLLSLASQLTFFWLWNLALLYIGGRHALNGKRIAALLVIVAWVLLLILIPTIANR